MPERNQKWIPGALAAFSRFTGPDWEQEGNGTFGMSERAPLNSGGEDRGGNGAEGWEILAEFNLPSDRGNEIRVMEKVVDAIQHLELPVANLQRIKTAVAETAMNAIEHGNHFQTEKPVEVVVKSSKKDLMIQISDLGGDQTTPKPELPDLEAKLDGLQPSRGWGLFLIKNMADEMRTSSDGTHFVVELVFHLEGSRH